MEPLEPWKRTRLTSVWKCVKLSFLLGTSAEPLLSPRMSKGKGRGAINLCHCLVQIAGSSNQSKIIQLLSSASLSIWSLDWTVILVSLLWPEAQYFSERSWSTNSCPLLIFLHSLHFSMFAFYFLSSNTSGQTDLEKPSAVMESS